MVIPYFWIIVVNILGIWEYDGNYDDLSYENDNFGSFFAGNTPFPEKKKNIWVLQVEGDSLVIIFTTDQYIDLGLFEVIYVCF